MSDLRFSQRMGLRPIHVAIQKEGMTDDLRNSLWNILYLDVLAKKGMDHYGRDGSLPRIVALRKYMWMNFYKEPIDQVSDQPKYAIPEIRERFFSAGWSEVYDIVEWFAALTQVDDRTIARLNEVLVRESSAYRLVDRKFVSIIDEIEIASIEAVLDDSAHTEAARHIRRALELHSDRESPDYRNSIKESISAVEAMAIFVTGEPNATLGAALKILEERHNLPTALKAGWSKLYGYTSDQGGIRHALIDESEPNESISRLMLVTCSAFVNYLKSLA
jgi:hypothetical protein